jgi:2-iminobutanoate/2-iminopropanoate deaminase
MRHRVLVATVAALISSTGCSGAPSRSDHHATAPARTIIQPAGWPPPPGYAQAIATRGGRLLVISGQVPLDTAGALVGGTDFPAQARQAFANLGTVLRAAGLSYADVVKLTYFVVGLDHDRLLALRAARDEVIPPGAPAASSLLGVTALFRPDVLIEIEALAELPPDGEPPR